MYLFVIVSAWLCHLSTCVTLLLWRRRRFRWELRYLILVIHPSKNSILKLLIHPVTLSDMRKALSRDAEKKSIIPLKRAVTPEELEYDWLNRLWIEFMGVSLLGVPSSLEEDLMTCFLFLLFALYIFGWFQNAWTPPPQTLQRSFNLNCLMVWCGQAKEKMQKNLSPGVGWLRNIVCFNIYTLLINLYPIMHPNRNNEFFCLYWREKKCVVSFWCSSLVIWYAICDCDDTRTHTRSYQRPDSTSKLYLSRKHKPQKLRWIW